MNIAIDIGNSRIKIGLFENGEMHISKLINNKEDVIDYFQKNNIHNSILSTVGKVPDWYSELEIEGRKVILTKETPMPINVDYATPESLGMDRLAASIGAFQRFPNKNCLIIDMGTCITYDFLDAKGSFRGGSISPGLQLRLRSMHENTAKLPLITDFEEEVKLTGKTTREAMISGAVMGLRQEIEGFIRSYRDKVANLQIIFTGGDFKMVENLLHERQLYVNHLVLEGLNGILEYNTEKQN